MTLVIGPIYEVYVVGQVRGEIINSSRPAVVGGFISYFSVPRIIDHQFLGQTRPT